MLDAFGEVRWYEICAAGVRASRWLRYGCASATAEAAARRANASTELSTIGQSDPPQAALRGKSRVHVQIHCFIKVPATLRWRLTVKDVCSHVLDLRRAQ